MHLTPRSAREEAGGLYQGALRVKVKAPPVDGKANLALLKLMAARLGVRRSDLEIVSGQTSRIKTLRVRGLTLAEVSDLLSDY